MGLIGRSVGSGGAEVDCCAVRAVLHKSIADDGHAVINRQLLRPHKSGAAIVALNLRRDAEIGLILKDDLIGILPNDVIGNNAPD